MPKTITSYLFSETLAADEERPLHFEASSILVKEATGDLEIDLGGGSVLRSLERGIRVQLDELRHIRVRDKSGASNTVEILFGRGADFDDDRTTVAGNVDTVPSFDDSPAVGQVSVASTATQIVAANASRAALNIQNMGANDMYLGGASVTTATGYRLQPGAGIDWPSEGAVYGIVASGTETACYVEGNAG